MKSIMDWTFSSSDSLDDVEEPEEDEGGNDEKEARGG
jgi:hypothetical protein